MTQTAGTPATDTPRTGTGTGTGTARRRPGASTDGASKDAVSFAGVVKTFGAVRAVDGIDLGVPRGEAVALLGRNGAGKSTAIGLLLGLDEPDSGTVRLFGGPPAHAVTAGRVGAMLQDGRPIRRVTVRELLTFVAGTYLLWAGALPFTLLGIGNGYRLSAQTTGVVNVGCLMVLSVVGGLWFPIAAFPGWLRTISEYTPANRFADLGWSTTQGTAPGVTTIAVLAGWLLVFGSYAVFSYRRSARTA
ncbi:ATP-binding cassette domain-containing protein [Streptomyces sp. NPDC059863]|uniref:ATP-binding cassette domain-containing protein n=1 Tax=unclassified Streptomyces TaxID=2593676 RepID=UPI003667ADD4